MVDEYPSWNILGGADMGFKLSLMSVVHFEKSSKTSWSLLNVEWVRFSASVRSSTYFQHFWGAISVAASFFVPCGNPLSGLYSLTVPDYISHMVHAHRLNHTTMVRWHLTPKRINFSIMRVWSTMSKALEKLLRTTVPTLITSAPECRKFKRLTK